MFFFAIILVNSRVGLPRCAIFTAIFSRKQAASILTKKVEFLLRKVDLSGDWVVLQNLVGYVCEGTKNLCAKLFLPILLHSSSTMHQ